jgi:hypothetical protein
VSVLVSYTDDEPGSVLMGYEAFQELVCTLWVAVEALQSSGVAPERGPNPDAQVVNLDWARRARRPA